ncbi:hypothetical protein [Solimonas terrae]|uniref:SH3 domain-containing protein n=1 Tax=Solimonas terrae TaxID=1396819 RepID=A0A6M2BLP3_9GAMM|nr:hypothetical protein [Solimonas terrae]NGY03344.1 hypothetical protein [Solimonas terrae]
MRLFKIRAGVPFALWWVALLHAPTVLADALSACAQHTGFEGVQTPPPQTAIVQIPQGDRLYIYKKPSSLCASSDDVACEHKSYIISGNAVAVGKTCGKWTYIKYRGDKKSTTGWVSSSGLYSSPDLQRDQNNYYFALTRGRGTPVCDAFLKRLNKTYFQYPPYCGIPEDDSVSGFLKLNRRMLSFKEARLLFSQIHWFSSTGAQSQGTPGDKRDDDLFDTRYRGAGGFYSTPAWRYDPPVDIDNDGHSDDIVVWQEAARTMTNTCGVRLSTGIGDYWRVGQQAFVMRGDGLYVDEGRTRSLFYRPPYNYHYKNGKVDTDFVPITLTTDIFKYRELFYFAGFYDAQEEVHGDLEGNRARQSNNKNAPFSSGLANTLAVFLRRDGKTTPICEYEVKAQQAGDE